MKYNPISEKQPAFSWGHLFVILIVAGLCLWAAINLAIERGWIWKGRQPVVNYTDITVKGFQP